MCAGFFLRDCVWCEYDIVYTGRVCGGGLSWYVCVLCVRVCVCLCLCIYHTCKTCLDIMSPHSLQCMVIAIGQCISQLVVLCFHHIHTMLSTKRRVA